MDHLNRSIQRIVAEEHFEFYQQEQSPKVRPFHKCEVILSFIGIEGNKAEFHGAYQVLGHGPFTKADLKQLPDSLAAAHQDGQPRIKYQLRELEAYRPYRARLIVQWKSTRGWHQKKLQEKLQYSSIQTTPEDAEEILIKARRARDSDYYKPPWEGAVAQPPEPREYTQGLRKELACSCEVCGHKDISEGDMQRYNMNSGVGVCKICMRSGKAIIREWRA